MAHEWESVSLLKDKAPFHPLQPVRRCKKCKLKQGQERLYEWGSYSIRGGPKVRGYEWLPKGIRCKPR